MRFSQNMAHMASRLALQEFSLNSNARTHSEMSCRRGVIGLPKVPSQMTVLSGCASSTCCNIEHVFTDSDYPLVIMVEPTQYRNSNHLAHCIMRGTRRPARFRNPLLNALMWSCPVEVCYILIEHALKLLLMEDQQVVKACLSHTPQEAFADRTGSWSVIGRFENLKSTRRSHTRETRSIFAIVITNQILRCLPIRRGFSNMSSDLLLPRSTRVPSRSEVLGSFVQ